MKTINLDATTWKTVLDVYEALLRALDAPMTHGRSLNALADSMIWTDKINGVRPPYRVRILTTQVIPEVVRQEVELIEKVIRESRKEFQERHGRDIEVEIETDLRPRLD